MAATDPRATISFDEIGAEYATFAIDNSTITYSATAARGSAVVDRAVKFSANKTVALCDDGDPIEGRLDGVEADGFARVQVGGFCQFPGGASATLTAGLKAVGDLDGSSNKGFIQAVSETVSGTPTQAEAQNAFKAARSKATIVDSSDTTAVWVRLDS